MIYILFIISFCSFVFLSSLKAYYDYLETDVITRKSTEKSKFSLPKAFYLLLARAFTNANNRTNWKFKKDKNPWRYGLVSGLKKFLGPLTLSALIFSILQFWMDNTTDIDFTESTIYEIEKAQLTIKSKIKYFVVGDGLKALIIFCLIFCASVYPIIEKLSIKDNFKKYSRLTKRTLLFLTITSSFTFFGSSFGQVENERVSKLKAHKLQIIKDNALLYETINDEVRSEVVNTIVNHPEFEETLAKLNELEVQLAENLSKDELMEYEDNAPEEHVAKIPIKLFQKENQSLTAFNQNFRYKIKEFETSKKTNSNFKDRTTYNEFKEKHSSKDGKSNWKESHTSKSKTKHASWTFEKANQEFRTNRSKFYTKYREPIEIVLKKGYSSTAKKWFNELIQFLADDIPFLEDLIEPIIHDPIESFITAKTDELFKKSYNVPFDELKNEIQKMSDEFSDSFDKRIKESDNFKLLKESLDDKLSRMAVAQKNTEIKITRYNKNVNHYLHTLNNQSRWEKIRSNFRNRIKTNHLGFSSSQIDDFNYVLDEWDQYKSKNKFIWYNQKAYNIESKFFKFLESNGRAKACWGFILQQQDWSGAVHYYNYIAPDLQATGKPYYLLKYYYNSIGKQAWFNSAYDGNTEYWVEEMCPPH